MSDFRLLFNGRLVRGAELRVYGALVKSKI